MSDSREESAADAGTDPGSRAAGCVVPAFCGLLPHPPIIVPDVGRDRLAECARTSQACEEFAKRLVASRPEVLFLVSPHAPRQEAAFGLYAGSRLQGDLSRFGAPRAAVDLPGDARFVDALEQTARDESVRTWRIPTLALDHGSVVPLWFVAQAGWQGPTAIASLPWNPSASELTAFGRAVARAAASLPGRVALIASGDMTHRALPGAPAGYHRRAVEFDRALTALVETARLDQICGIDPRLRELAAEDAADSSTIVAAAIGFESSGAEVISYEHPFGVGYLVAVFHDGAGDGGNPRTEGGA